MIGTTELLIIGGVILVLFGASAIPKLAKSIGQAKKEFDKGIKEGARDLDSEEENESPGEDNSDNHSENK